MQQSSTQVRSTGQVMYPMSETDSESESSIVPSDHQSSSASSDVGHQGQVESESDESDWSLEDEDDEEFPRVALSSTSPSERSEDISVTDSDADTSSSEPQHEIIAKYNVVNDYYVYEEEIVDELMHRHFKDDDEISVSTIELDDFLTRHSWDLDERFRISFRIPYVPAVRYISENFMKYLKLSLALQAHHLIFAILWTFMCFKFLLMDDNESTLAFTRYAFFMRPVMVCEAGLNYIMPVLGFIRHVNQKIRTLVIFHNIIAFINVCHLSILVYCSGYNVYIFSNMDQFAEDAMRMGTYTVVWQHTEVIRQCCGTESKLDWKFNRRDPDFSLPESCCDWNWASTIRNCTAQSKYVWSKGCYSSSSDEMRAVRIFAWVTFIMLTLSLYHNISTYIGLTTVRSFLKAYNHHLVYGLPKWVRVRHTEYQYNYAMNIEEDEEPMLEEEKPTEEQVPLTESEISMMEAAARRRIESFLEF